MSTTPPAGVADLTQLHTLCEAARLCALGHHAWVPWLELPNGSFITWCCRDGCEAEEQYDHQQGSNDMTTQAEPDPIHPLWCGATSRAIAPGPGVKSYLIDPDTPLLLPVERDTRVVVLTQKDYERLVES